MRSLTRIVVVGEVANCPFVRVASFETLVRLGAFAMSPSRKRLAALGLDLTKLSSLNLCSPGRWDRQEARRNAVRLTDEMHEAEYLRGVDKVILSFGSRATAAFGFRFVVMKEYHFLPHVRVVSLPHPSPVNRFWNSAENRIEVRDGLARLVGEVLADTTVQRGD